MLLIQSKGFATYFENLLIAEDRESTKNLIRDGVVFYNQGPSKLNFSTISVKGSKTKHLVEKRKIYVPSSQISLSVYFPKEVDSIDWFVEDYKKNVGDYLYKEEGSHVFDIVVFADLINFGGLETLFNREFQENLDMSVRGELNAEEFVNTLAAYKRNFIELYSKHYNEFVSDLSKYDQIEKPFGPTLPSFE